MPIFRCLICDAVENTALGDYWTAKTPKCSECETGKWHGEFPKQTVHEAGLIEGDDGFWCDPGELAPGGYFNGKVKAKDINAA